jgi:NAD(P)-dependent dehydrogenase (short-subunit alcohol dehydrogenase family)
VAIVTGAGRGLGRGCAIELAAAGATVVLVARTSADLDEAASAIGKMGGRGVPLTADARQPESMTLVVNKASELGDVRVLVTAVGTNRVGPANTYPLTDWDLLFDLNVRATFIACQAFAAHIFAVGRPGAIVTMSSQMGSVGYPGRVAYCSSKHAVDGMTRALAVEWARDDIRVNAVAPTFVETSLTMPMMADPELREEVLKRRLPTGRLARIEDVARAVRYLASDASANVTGHVLNVDGGWTAW